MNFSDSFKQNIFSLKDTDFESASLAVFDYQFKTNDIYKTYCNQLKKNPENVKKSSEIPFLPIDFFKYHHIKSGKWKEEKVFLSSGTTLKTRSRHYVRNLEFYREVSRTIFESFFSPLQDLTVYALLPSYQQQGDSSLIYMIDHFIQKAKEGSGYFLENPSNIKTELEKNEDKKMLIGVSYALLNVIENEKIETHNTLIFETGGMKGRRRELVRQELHQILKTGFKAESISSEYGMTELFSQAYAVSNGNFNYPNWMKFRIRDINDPFCYLPNNKTGGINVVDLSNIDTCAFIETQDLGKLLDNQILNILGRFDNSDIRGCNLLIN